MADPFSYGNSERDIDKALLTLKKGAQLIKYSRKGKPRFCPFRISTDEKTLIWYSRKQERNLKLSSVSKIIPGQRTAVFRRYPCPEKDYLSFSLLYNNGERTLDVICRDKVDAEVWFTGLKVLISTGSRSYPPDFQDGGDFLQIGRLSGASLESTTSIPCSFNSKAFAEFFSGDSPSSLAGSDVGSCRANMQARPSTEGFRISVSSAPSCSSGCSADDNESLGDVYVWGEVLCDGGLTDGSGKPCVSKTDVLLPKPLESNVVLDVSQISCGVNHAALVTRQGEVFTWGEESGGRLGHGVDTDYSRPKLVDFLAVNNVDYIACGEYHTCAISVAGDVYTWGDGTQNAGLLGHAADVSHWIPKRISGPLEGVQVLSIACGTWHSAMVTSDGRLFTYGDGTFGVLGHGNRESVTYPREVESLRGVKTTKVSCGTWHTAAIVEVMGQTGANRSSTKLFTWGDGDKYRLGHGDKETRLIPTCIPSLVDYNFQQVTCGHYITVALTTSGHVFTMGSTAYGQLGNPLSDGKLPCLMQDKLVGEFVEDISCGESHVVVLTSRSEVFTWGRGANGRLGHGDIENRKGPTLVEALKDRHVKSISCGSNFTACVCIHKWVSSADQSMCSGCRQAFGFTKKRNNCYNCGLVYCSACSSRKALRAALAPTPGKPYRVCDPCYAKLKASESGSISTFGKSVTPRRSIDRERFATRSSKMFLLDNMEAVKPIHASTSSTHPGMTLRAASSYSRRPSPPHSAAPVLSKSVIDTLKKTNELLNQEVLKLQSQVKGLKEKREIQDMELKLSLNKGQEAAFLAEDKGTKSKVAKEVLYSINYKLKDLKDKFPPEVYDSDSFKAMDIQLENFLKTNETMTSEVPDSRSRGTAYQSIENGSKTPKTPRMRSEGEKLSEQFDTGVYVTFIQLPDGTKIFKQIRFSRKQFSGEQAGDWWRENSRRLFEKYKSNDNNKSTTETASIASGSGSTVSTASTGEEDGSSTVET